MSMDEVESGMKRPEEAKFKSPILKDPWIHRSSSMSCATCMWYVQKAKVVGRCRRHAPTTNGYPVVFETDWCGDHKLDENCG